MDTNSRNKTLNAPEISESKTEIEKMLKSPWGITLSTELNIRKSKLDPLSTLMGRSSNKTEFPTPSTSQSF